MSQYVLSVEAREDLAEIVEYIARDKPRAARRVLKKIEDAIGRVADMPMMGHLREDLTDKPFRFWPVYSYLIIYLPETPLQVVRILHGARDVKAILARGF